MDLWASIHRERERLAALLRTLDEAQWQTRSLCADWTVEEVTAHLTAAASTGTLAWLGSMLRAGFRPARHNARMVRRYRGATPQGTLQAFERAIDLRIAPTPDLAGFLGEVVVHGQDIARPLGLELRPDADGLRAVASFFATKDFAVNSARLVRGLRLSASDADFVHGTGPEVTGTLLDLVLAMAGRPSASDALEGEGVVELRDRLADAA